MDEEILLSAGIDIGTSTTQLIFSRLKVKNTGGFGRIPETKITSKEVIYESPIYFTPLLSQNEIDGKKVSEIIKKEYENAGIKPEDLNTGAVIITGETLAKKNSKSVIKEISDNAGKFVVAAAGSDLEAVLAGKGSGAQELSLKRNKRTVNIDIGGGTSNICFFEDGEVKETGCLDIGGRLIKIEKGRIVYIAEKIKQTAEKYKINIKENDYADINELKKITDIMAEILAEAVKITSLKFYDSFINTEHEMNLTEEPEIISFSGGVAECLKRKEEGREYDNIFEFGDIGILLAQSIKENRAFKNKETVSGKETVRATVIGAGNYTVNISGSTIYYSNKNIFPLKNIPVIKIPLAKKDDTAYLKENIKKSVKLFLSAEREVPQFALSFKGIKCPSFNEIECIAENIIQSYRENFENNINIIVISEEDTAKVLGQALKRKIKKAAEENDDKLRSIVSIDSIKCSMGDFIDLGEPVASGTAIPVVVKTLVFKRKEE